MSVILDILLLIAVIAAFVRGCRKGFVKPVRSVLALVITIVLVIVLKNPVLEFLSGTDMAQNISARISDTVHIPQGGGVNIAQSLNLPEAVQETVAGSISSVDTAVSSINDTVSSSLTGLFMTIIVCIGLFIIIRLLLMVVFLIIDAAAKLPVIKGTNKLLGGVLGVVNIVFLVLVLLAVFSLFAPADSAMYDAINSTYAVKYFYNYNILLQLFMKI